LIDFYALLRPVLFRLDAEKAHGLTIKALNSPFGPQAAKADDRILGRRLIGLDFPNPLGMAAGFDKNGQAVDAVLRLGFGFAEVGTVTPRPQDGNPKPRLFRLAADRAVINRFGFANLGHAALREKLIERQRQGYGGVVGVNIGANKDTIDRIDDYVAGIEAFADVASYFTINVSSPNTPGLRDLQARDALDQLLMRVTLARDDAADLKGRRVPLLLKIAPDMDETALNDVTDMAKLHAIDGMIVSNTTLSRDGLVSREATETGGLSGRPLFERSTRMLALTRTLVGRDMLIIGVGGIESAATAWDKLAAGADLIQVYSGLVYEGPSLVQQILSGLVQRMKARKMAGIADVVGSETECWL
jgi:dihydroorotate dehydrogenase